MLDEQHKQIEALVWNTMVKQKQRKIESIAEGFEMKDYPFNTELKSNIQDDVPFKYKVEDKEISFTPSWLRWNNDKDKKIVIKEGVNSSDGKLIDDHQVKYENVFGHGLNLLIKITKLSWRKILEIETLESLGNIPIDSEFLEVGFKVNTDIDIKDLKGKDFFEIEGNVDLTEFSRIRKAVGWDNSGGEQIPIKSYFKKEDEELYLIKQIPISWLKKTIFPIFTDITIEYGSQSVFNAASTGYLCVAALDATHAFVAYRDSDGYGRARVALISGTTISSYGTESTFYAGPTSYVKAVALDATHVFIAYNRSSVGKAIVAEISGTTISSYGSENEFCSQVADYICIDKIDSTHVCIIYRRQYANGTLRIALISGTTISSFGSESDFITGSSAPWQAVTALDTTHIFVAYCDYSNSYYGTGRVALISGTTISSWGTAEVFISSNVSINMTAVALDSTHVFIAYQDEGDSNHGKSRVALISGTTISSYGTENEFLAAAVKYVHASKIDATHVFLISSVLYDGVGRIGTITGTTIVYAAGDDEKFEEGGGGAYGEVCTLDAGGHVFIAFPDKNNGTGGTGIVGEFTIPTPEPSGAIKDIISCGGIIPFAR